MKKKLLALGMAAALLLGLCGCVGNLYEYAGAIDGTQISSGLYLMAQYAAYSEARNLLGDTDSADSILKEEIEGVNAKDWIVSHTEESLRRYVAVQRLAREKGITLSSESQQNVDQMMQYWEYIGESYANNGISQSTVLRYSNNAELANQLFVEVFGEGGELQVPDEELKEEYGRQYAHVKFFSLPTNKLEPTVDMSAEIEALSEEIVAEMQGGTSLEDAADAYGVRAYDILEREGTSAPSAESVATSYTDLYPDSFETYSEEFLTELKDMPIGGYGYYNMGATVIVFEKIVLFENDEEFENMRASVLSSIKQEEYEEYLSGISAAYTVEWKFGARAFLSPNKIKYA